VANNEFNKLFYFSNRAMNGPAKIGRLITVGHPKTNLGHKIPPKMKMMVLKKIQAIATM